MDEGLDGDQGLTVDATVSPLPPPPRSARRRLAAALYRHPRTQLIALLSAPLGWMLIVYIGSLVVLFISAFWHLDPFSGDIVTEPLTLQNFEELLTTPIYWTVAIRTIGFAAIVTVTDILLAFPIAYYMARVAKPRTRSLLVVSILLPLWSGYLVKVYAWRLILAEDGMLNWLLEPFGLKGPGYGDVAVWLVMSYLWLPYMIIPLYAGLERIPSSLLEASSDLGARSRIDVPAGHPAARRSRPSSPARSSRSRSPSATTSRRRSCRGRSSSATSSTRTSASPGTSRWPRPMPSCPRS